MEGLITEDEESSKKAIQAVHKYNCAMYLEFQAQIVKNAIAY